MDKIKDEKEQLKTPNTSITDPGPFLSMVVPTYNERDNIKLLIEKISSVEKEHNLPLELIIVDDDSPDGTSEEARSLNPSIPLKVITRRWRRGLSSAVLEGFEVADGKIFGIMDADLSHDYRIIPDMVKAITEEGYDIALGSRYIPTGSFDRSWPLKRRLLSFIGTKFAKRLIPVHDPLSGFILFKKSILDGVKLNTYGFKIALEILVRTRNTNIKEIPYVFVNRQKGKSKIGLRTMLGYLFQICELYIFKYTGK
jgi:dolichol-phosphate mannosyltransferase